MRERAMLQNDLYTIRDFGLSETGDKISAKILLNKEHPVFKGHFPGNPILPGACTVQITLELLEKGIGKELMLTKASNIKYLGFINPVTTPEVLFDLAIKNTDTGLIGCNTTVSLSGTVLCSFKGEYKYESAIPFSN
jgi:3-hydroxyacyl-[acyl-carrier-protein] dehydratase